MTLEVWEHLKLHAYCEPKFALEMDRNYRKRGINFSVYSRKEFRMQVIAKSYILQRLDGSSRNLTTCILWFHCSSNTKCDPESTKTVQNLSKATPRSVQSTNICLPYSEIIKQNVRCCRENLELSQLHNTMPLRPIELFHLYSPLFHFFEYFSPIIKGTEGKFQIAST